MNTGHQQVNFIKNAFRDFREVMFLKDTMDRYVFITRSCPSLFNIPPSGSVIGKTDLDVLRDPTLGARHYKEDLQILTTGKGLRTLDEIEGDSGPIYLEVIRDAIRDDNGTIIGISGVIDDVTELVNYKKKFEQLSLYDSLTHTYSRHYTAKFDFDSPTHLPCSYIMCDCNDLKEVNDRQGHTKGDEYICQTANLLRRACAPQSVLVRWGSDEFLIITPNCTNQDHLHLLQRIQQEQEAAQKLHPYLNIAVGGAVRHSVSSSESAIIQQADHTMYLDKARLKTGVS